MGVDMGDDDFLTFLYTYSVFTLFRVLNVLLGVGCLPCPCVVCYFPEIQRQSVSI